MFIYYKILFIDLFIKIKKFNALIYTIPYHTIPHHTTPYHTIPYYIIYLFIQLFLPFLRFCYAQLHFQTLIFFPPLFQCTENVDTKDSGLHFRLLLFCGFFQKALSEEWPDDTLPQPTEPSFPLARLLTNMASQEELRRKKKGLLPTSQNSAARNLVSVF